MRSITLWQGDAFIKPLDELQAADGASALQKAVYGRMFDSIVSRLNSLISVEEGVNPTGEKQAAFIGMRHRPIQPRPKKIPPAHPLPTPMPPARADQATIVPRPGILDIFGFESFVRPRSGTHRLMDLARRTGHGPRSPHVPAHHP